MLLSGRDSFTNVINIEEGHRLWVLGNRGRTYHLLELQD
jgi:hypothetical protein